MFYCISVLNIMHYSLYHANNPYHKIDGSIIHIHGICPTVYDSRRFVLI